jgi:predicted HicB family RNase H-like nuclease
MTTKKRPRGRPHGVTHDDIVFFRCEKTMHERLKELAAADDRPIAQYVRQLIKRHFEHVDHDKQKGRKQAK